jgi:hypothetical protein
VNVQRTAAGIGAFLVLVIGTTLCVVTAGALAGLTSSAAFGVTFKTFLVLALLVSTLGAFMRWGQGGSMRLWLGIALAAYVALPSTWAASTLFSASLGVPPAVAWFADGVVWMALAWWTARRVLPEATLDDGLHRLR